VSGVAPQGLSRKPVAAGALSFAIVSSLLKCCGELNVAAEEKMEAVAPPVTPSALDARGRTRPVEGPSGSWDGWARDTRDGKDGLRTC